MAEGQAAAGRGAVEVLTLLQDAVHLDRRAPLRAEQIRLDEADLRQLADAGELQVERERLTATEQVLLLEEDSGPDKTPAGIQTQATGTNASVRMVSDEADEVSIEADMPRPGFLLLLDTYFPGWTATVDGLPTHIFRADYNFRAVKLPAGKSTVRFAYQPGSFRLGIVLFAIGLLILVIAWLWPRKLRASESSLATGKSRTG